MNRQRQIRCAWMRQRLCVVFLCVLPCACAWSEDPVYIPDPTLKEVIEDALWISDPTPTDMLDLMTIEYICGWAGEGSIADLTGLEYAKNLQSLTLDHNQFSDLSALSSLSELRTLIVPRNQISDLSPLSGLLQLETLDLEADPVVDVSPLSGLPNLSWLNLHRTQVNDISPLVSLTSLTMLDLRLAPLDADDYYVYMPLIYANNPGITISYMRYYDNPQILTITSSAGGSVINPGEGEFTYELGETAILRAEPDKGFKFLNWSGQYYSEQNPTTLAMNQDYAIQANFERISNDNLYVDDDAPADVGPNDSSVSDPSEDGSEANPFDCIQEAIDSASNGTTIIVRPGTYRENVDLLGKRVYLTALDPADPCGGPCATIEGTADGPVVYIPAGSDGESALSGFVITRGFGQAAGAIYCDGASPTISNCLIVGNRTTLLNGAAVHCTDSQATLVNCTIANNYASQQGAGLTLIDSDITMLNSILWDNVPSEIIATGTSSPDIRCCTIQDGWADSDTLQEDPLFAQSGSWVDPNDPTLVQGADIEWAVWTDGDYHLRSRVGRWDLATQDWVQDNATSPCIDAGLESDSVGSEPNPNGDRINMGAYGGTTEASMSPSGS